MFGPQSVKSTILRSESIKRRYDVIQVGGSRNNSFYHVHIANADMCSLKDIETLFFNLVDIWSVQIFAHKLRLREQDAYNIYLLHQEAMKRSLKKTDEHNAMGRPHLLFAQPSVYSTAVAMFLHVSEKGMHILKDTGPPDITKCRPWLCQYMKRFQTGYQTSCGHNVYSNNLASESDESLRALSRDLTLTGLNAGIELFARGSVLSAAEATTTIRSLQHFIAEKGVTCGLAEEVDGYFKTEFSANCTLDCLTCSSANIHTRSTDGLRCK